MPHLLKFRCWDGSKFLDNEDFFIQDGKPAYHLEFEGWDYIDGGIVQQFTGLKDKNGKEIFEGDIYNLKGWANNPYYCVWHDGAYWNRQIKQNYQDFLHNHVNLYCESQHDLRSHAKYASIIGNIFENPELLTK